MPLVPGSRFGSFEVAALLGAGGMGEVYHARDPRLNRGVALKILLELSARDPDRLARFKREAQLLASLSHPNIAAIYGVEEADGVHALVLELVDGPTLAEQITHGPIAMEDALPLARQIADALEAAHEIGIVHRDLKPANIKVSDKGIVKVLDFGLAKATDPALSSAELSQSPTLTTGATRAGVILGTAAYMSPEQARGKAVDRRADVWAFGCVLYEMLTGRRAFEGEVISETLAAVLRGEPDWTALPESTPRAIERLLRRCLQKDPRERLQSIGDARIEITEATKAGGDATGSAAAPARPPQPATARVDLIAAAALAGAILAGAAVWMLKPSAAAAPSFVTRSLLAVQPFDQRSPARPGENRVPITRRDRTSIALTPDGRTLVVRALSDITEQLWVRPLDKLGVHAARGDGAVRTSIPVVRRPVGRIQIRRRVEEDSDRRWNRYHDRAHSRRTIGAGHLRRELGTRRRDRVRDRTGPLARQRGGRRDTPRDDAVRDRIPAHASAHPARRPERALHDYHRFLSLGRCADCRARVGQR
jgi:hypothetical protein